MLLDIFSTDSLSVVNAEATVSTLDKLLDYLLDVSVALGTKIVASIIVFIVGRWVIGWIRKFFDKFLLRRRIEETVRSFLDSLPSMCPASLFLFSFIG